MLIYKKKKRRKKRRKKKKAPMTRKVYLMERIRGREWNSILNGRREIKIGIGIDAGDRNKGVDKGIPGKVVLIYERTIENASTFERGLHLIYEKWNFKPKGAKRGAGSTEFFKLTPQQVKELKKFIDSHSRREMPVSLRLAFWFLILLLIYSIIT